MSFGLKQIALAGLATLVIGTSAQATDVNVTIHAGGYGAPQRIADYSGEFLEHRQHRYRDERYERRGPARSFERDVPEWRHGRPYGHGYHEIPVGRRPVFAEPHRGYRPPCRIIITERVNRWGDKVRVQREVCR
jgi:hypothetical protein